MSSTVSSADRPSIPWLLGHSSWMLLTLIPGGILAWLGFMIVGIAGRMPRWAITGVGLGVASIVAHLEIWWQYRPIFIAVVYITGMLLALWANPQWLTARWERVATGSSMSAQRAARGWSADRDTAAQTRERERAVREERERADSARREARSSRRRSSSAGATTKSAARTVSAEAQTQTLAETAGATSAGFFAAPATAPAAPVDVNTASSDDIADLPGMTRSKARQLVKQRDKAGGWVSLEAFATAAKVQPHELVRLREAATCSPRPRGPRTFGRRVDY